LCPKDGCTSLRDSNNFIIYKNTKN
jgi:hypothetical protein